MSSHLPPHSPGRKCIPYGMRIYHGKRVGKSATPGGRRRPLTRAVSWHPEAPRGRWLHTWWNGWTRPILALRLFVASSLRLRRPLYSILLRHSFLALPRGLRQVPYSGGNADVRAVTASEERPFARKMVQKSPRKIGQKNLAAWKCHLPLFVPHPTEKGEDGSRRTPWPYSARSLRFRHRSSLEEMVKK